MRRSSYDPERAKRTTELKLETWGLREDMHLAATIMDLHPPISRLTTMNAADGLSGRKVKCEMIGRIQLSRLV